jgi:hypothetical protein
MRLKHTRSKLYDDPYERFVTRQQMTTPEESTADPGTLVALYTNVSYGVEICTTIVDEQCMEPLKIMEETEFTTTYPSAFSILDHTP